MSKKLVDRLISAVLSSGSERISTVVILHKACYGHQPPDESFVERPERLLACLLGIMTASSAIEKITFDDAIGPSLLCVQESQRQVNLRSDAVLNVHTAEWISQLDRMSKDASATPRDTRHVDVVGPSGIHTQHALAAEMHIGPDSLEAIRGALGGMYDAVDTVCDPKGSKRRAFVCVRPPGHHCSAQLPAGFCWLNNLFVSIEYAMQSHQVSHAAIIDFDLHHGDGSQQLALQRHSANVGYFSLHDIGNYPYRETDASNRADGCMQMEEATGFHIWNEHLAPWAKHREFWQQYEERYLTLLQKSENFLRMYTSRLLQEQPDRTPRSMIFISAGFDASIWEASSIQRAEICVPTIFFARATADIVKLSLQKGLSCDGRVVSVLEGGYNARALWSGVTNHIIGLALGPDMPFEQMQSWLKRTSSLLPWKNLERQARAARFSNERGWWPGSEEPLVSQLLGVLNPTWKEKFVKGSSDQRQRKSRRLTRLCVSAPPQVLPQSVKSKKSAIGSGVQLSISDLIHLTAPISTADIVAELRRRRLEVF